MAAQPFLLPQPSAPPDIVLSSINHATHQHESSSAAMAAATLMMAISSTTHVTEDAKRLQERVKQPVVGVRPAAAAGAFEKLACLRDLAVSWSAGMSGDDRLAKLGEDYAEVEDTGMLALVCDVVRHCFAGTEQQRQPDDMTPQKPAALVRHQRTMWLDARLRNWCVDFCSGSGSMNVTLNRLSDIEADELEAEYRRALREHQEANVRRSELQRFKGRISGKIEKAPNALTPHLLGCVGLLIAKIYPDLLGETLETPHSLTSTRPAAVTPHVGYTRLSGCIHLRRSPKQGRPRTGSASSFSHQEDIVVCSSAPEIL